MKAAKKHYPKSPQVRVDVTEEIIRESMQADSSHCMIAEAVKKARPKATRVAVDLATIRFSDPELGLRYTYLTPRTAQTPLLQFDSGMVPEPFSFMLGRGHVTRMSRSKKTKATTKSLSRARLVTREGVVGGKVPDRVGGRPLPTFRGNRREFGIRGLGKVPPVPDPEKSATPF
jgi:hypothetical protein